MRVPRLFASGVLLATVIAPCRDGAAAKEPGVTWLVFVDDFHLDFVNTGHIRTLMRSVASELIREGDAFALRSPGPSPSIPLTTNRTLLDGAIGRVAGGALQPALILRLSPAKELQNEMRYRASLSASAATEMLRADSRRGRVRRRAAAHRPKDAMSGPVVDAEVSIAEYDGSA